MQHFLKTASGTARTLVVPTELLMKKLLVAVNDSIATLYPCL
jgi:hypothetical protein